MVRKKSDEPTPEEKGLLDKLLESPLKLVVFCVSLLFLSLSGGMLIGSLVKEGPKPAARISITVPTVKPDAPTIPPSEEVTGTLRSSRPVDALDHDNPYTVPRTEETPSSKPRTGSTSATTASLPPQTSTKATPGSDPAWKRFAARTPIIAEGTPLIAIVIDDVGLNSSRVEALIRLPNILTLAFLPYARGLDTNVRLTRENGHEVMLHLPMEPISRSADPGPDALLNALDLEEIRRRTIANLDRFSGYVGVNNHMGSKFTAYEEGMAVVMDVIRDRGYLFLDSKTTPKSSGYRLAKERGIPTGIRDVFIDNAINEKAILKQLKTVEAIARKNGIAIAIGHPHKETIASLKKWMPDAATRGFQFIPVSKALVPQKIASQ
ncbi:MAG: divergent polysaccharide deacetylase family protein [Sneathiella sp.]